MFVVEQVEIERLAFSPAALSLAVGQRKSFEVYAVTPRGRRRLGDDPDLKLSVSEADGSIIELSAPSREVLPFTWTAGRVELTVPEIVGHAMVVIE